MEAFFTRKRRRSLAKDYEALTGKDAFEEPHGSQDDTDLKLTLLASLHPGLDQDALLEALLAHDGDVDTASKSLVGQSNDEAPRKKHRVDASIGHQSSLSKFNIGSTDRRKELQSLTKKGKTLHLYSPEDIEVNCPCTLVLNFLPTDLATSLLKELLAESPTYERDTFKLFDNIVQSPHTICFYVDDYDEAERQKTEYIYNGAQVKDVRASLPVMREVSAVVRERVNKEVDRRIKDFYPGGKKLTYQSGSDWRPNSAFVNCYDGGKESVGYHSDQLTYLGPRAVIGSLSLGVAREFRIRKIVARDETGPGGSSSEKQSKIIDEKRADQEGQIAIHLPHNSLLIMHAEMQEEWKHSIAPAQTVTPHPLAQNKRLNITYRHYRPYLHPRYTPRCKCGTPCVLRCVQRRKLTRGRYCWMCHANYSPSPDQKGCGWFEWAVFDVDGRPTWAEGFLGEAAIAEQIEAPRTVTPIDTG